VSDPLTRLRERIAAQDRAILAAVNARLELVAELKRYKARTGIEFVDPEQEQRLLRALQNANDGPLSSDGLSQLFEQILALTKRELES
jgi:chorismate mutase